MGWSDITISMKGPIVTSLLDHFIDRWYVLATLQKHHVLLFLVLRGLYSMMTC